MKELTVEITNESGLHARPATRTYGIGTAYQDRKRLS